MNPFVIPTKFIAVDQMTSQVRGMTMNVHDAFNKLGSGIARHERLFRRLTPGIGDATKQLLSYASAGTVLAGIGFSGKAIMDYETAIQSLSAVTGVSGDLLQVYKGEIDDVAKHTKKSATEIAGSYEVIGSMMSQYLKDPKALREISEAGITLSKASRQELVPTLEQLTSIMNQFDLKANKAKDTINRLTAGEIVGSLRTSEVAESLQEFGAGAYAANIELSESVALVEALAKQMKHDKIGVGARNILTVLDSATGLARKARKELRHAGVDMHFLMDKSKTLSERLHELAKVAGNEKAITKIFGRENKTAAQVIFNQLDVYDKFLAQIRQTNEAENQAATNSRTLATSIEHLKNTWLNYLVSGDKANEGLEKANNAIHFLTDNMDGIVSTGLNVIKFYALWKGGILAMKGVMLGYNVTLMASNAIANAYFLVDMVKYVAVTQGVTRATAAWQIIQQSLNNTLLANPVGLTLTGLAALAGGIYLLNQRNRELAEQYQEKAQLDITGEVQRETKAVEQLVEKYYLLGKSIQQANAMAMIERKTKLDEDRAKSERRIEELKQELQNKKRRNFETFGIYGAGFNDMFHSDGETAKQLAEEQRKAKLIAADQSFEVQRAKQAVDQGVVNFKDVASFFALPKKKDTDAPSESSTPINYFGEKKDTGPMIIDYNKMREALQGSQRVIVEFKGAPAGTTASNGANVSTPSSY